jgi:hypothetical protein
LLRNSQICLHSRRRHKSKLLFSAFSLKWSLIIFLSPSAINYGTKKNGGLPSVKYVYREGKPPPAAKNKKRKRSEEEKTTPAGPIIR